MHARRHGVRATVRRGQDSRNPGIVRRGQSHEYGSGMTEVLELAAVAWALYGLTKLDRLLRATALLGILIGAIAASGSLELNINARVVTGWALAGILIAAVLFHHEILRRLR